MRHLVLLEMGLQIIAHLAFNCSDFSSESYLIFRLSFMLCRTEIRLNFRLKFQHGHLLI